MTGPGWRQMEINCPWSQCAEVLAVGFKLLITAHHLFIHSFMQQVLFGHYHVPGTGKGAGHTAMGTVVSSWSRHSSSVTQQCAGRRVFPQHSRSSLVPGNHARPSRTAPKRKGCFGVSHLLCLPNSHTALVSAPQHHGAGSGVGAGAGMASNEAPEDCGSKTPEVSHPK